MTNLTEKLDKLLRIDQTMLVVVRFFSISGQCWHLTKPGRTDSCTFPSSQRFNINRVLRILQADNLCDNPSITRYHENTKTKSVMSWSLQDGQNMSTEALHHLLS